MDFNVVLIIDVCDKTFITLLAESNEIFKMFLSMTTQIRAMHKHFRTHLTLKRGFIVTARMRGQFKIAFKTLFAHSANKFLLPHMRQQMTFQQFFRFAHSPTFSTLKTAFFAFISARHQTLKFRLGIDESFEVFVLQDVAAIGLVNGK